MPAANQSDFLGESVFGSQQQNVHPDDAPNPNNPGGISNNRLKALRAQQAASSSRRYYDPAVSTGGGSAEQQQAAADAQQARIKRPSRYDTESVWGDIADIWTTDPVTTAVLAAPYAVGAAGALIPAAAAGPGITTPITGAPSLGAVGTMPASMFGATPIPAAAAAAPAAAGAAGALPAVAGAAAPAAAGAASSWLTPSTAIGLGGLGLSGIQVIDALGGNSKEEKQLLAKQEELAQATEQRRKQAEQERLNRLGQQLMAFNPLNQAMANMYGPQAAFSPEAMGALAGDPAAKAGAAGQPEGVGYTPEEIMRANADARRRQSVQAAFQQPGPGPAPLQPRAPQAARRF